MSYYTALINAWNSATQPPSGVTGTGLTGLTTAQKLVAINGWTVTGTIPTTFYTTGSAVLNCINITEFNNLTAAQQSNLLALCNNPGQLLSGSGQTANLTAGMIISYFTISAAISSGTYNNSTGLVTLTMSASIKFGVGGNVIVSGLTGTGAFASLNGTFLPVSASGTTVTYNAGAGLGAATITGGSLAPPTLTALEALAQATVTPWWQANGYSSQFDQADLTSAGGLS
jgi:hypothetical protein